MPELAPGQSGRTTQWLALALAGAVLAWGIAPSVGWYDSGELGAAAVGLDVAHPTGFPLLMLAGHGWARVPLGEAGLRLNAFGAAGALVACALLAAALAPARVRATEPAPLRSRSAIAVRAVSAALLGAATLLLPLLQPALWLHVASFEVYPLVWCVVGAGVAAWAGLAGGRRIVALALLTGVGCGVHVEAAGLAACGVVAATVAAGLGLGKRNLRPGDAARSLAVPLSVGAALGACAALGLAYLPLAAARHPLLDWGAVRGWDAFADHLSAASIRDAFADRIGAQPVEALRALGQLLARNATLLWAPAAVGVVAGVRRAPTAALAVLGVMVLDAWYSVALNPMGLRDDQAGLLLLLGIGTFAACGLDAVVRLAPPGTSRALVALAALGFVAVQAGVTLAARPAADTRAAATWRDGVLRQVVPGALAVTASDALSAACAWRQGAEGGRPDVAWLPGVFARSAPMLEARAARPGLAALAVAAAVARAGPRVGTTESRDSARFAARLLGSWLRPLVAARPVAWEAGLAAEDAQVRALYLPDVPFGALVPGGVPASRLRAALIGLRARVDAAAGRALSGVDPLRPALPPTLALELGTTLSVAAAGAGHTQPDLALPLALAALAYAPHEARVLNNAAALLMTPATAGRALGLAEAAVVADPLYARAHRSAARAAVIAGASDRTRLHASAWVRSRTGDATLGAWLEELATLAADPTLAADLRALAATQHTARP